MESENSKSFSYAEIKKLVSLLESSSLQCMSLRRGEHRVKLSKASPVQSVQASQFPVAVHGSATSQQLLSATTSEQSVVIDNASSNIESGTNATEGEAIVSPMVGTFYRAPSPEHANFVETGSVVEQGQVLCIIEAMKMMNQIKAPRSGKIGVIEATNGQPVEFGQTLMYIL